MTMIERVERGWPGHFVGAEKCVFHRNTLLTDGRLNVIVSTVGDYRPSDDYETEIIGHNRYYETMCFLGELDEDGYIDADVTRKITFESNWCITGEEFCGNSDNDANDMHENVVAEIERKMMNGEISQ